MDPVASAVSVAEELAAPLLSAGALSDVEGGCVVSSGNPWALTSPVSGELSVRASSVV